METAGWGAVVLGVLLSAAILLQNVRVMRATEPYAGMRRLGPEMHVLGGIATGIGAGLLGGVWIGLAAGVLQVALGIVAFILMDR